MARILKKTFERAGYAVDVEYDSDAGLAMAESVEYDGLIIDRMIPGEITDGADLVKHLRQKNINTPALILTALSQTADKVTGLDSGADDYLTKPFSIDELLARVRALVRRPPKQIDEILTIGQLQLNSTTKTVTFDETPIELTAKEFALLHFLMSKNGNVASKESILEHVWDFDSDILPNTIEVYIKNLRSKIDEKFNVSLIKTVRGQGYKIESDPR